MHAVQAPAPLLKGMIKCHTCGAAIAKSARTCPQCGAPPKRSARGLLAFLIFAGLIAAVVVVSQQSSEEKQQRRDEVRTTVSVVDVTADQLHKDYNANEVGADATYKDKVLRVTGAVQGIKKGITDKPYLVLWTTNEFSGVHANFDNDGVLGTLKVGDHVTVQCRGAGMIMGSPMLHDCVLQIRW